MKKRSPSSKTKSGGSGGVVVALLLVLMIGATIGAAVFVRPRRAQIASPSAKVVLGQQSSLTDRTDVDASLDGEVPGVDLLTTQDGDLPIEEVLDDGPDGPDAPGGLDAPALPTPVRRTLQVANVGFDSATVSVEPSELGGTWNIEPSDDGILSKDGTFTGLEPGNSYTVTWTGATDQDTLQTLFETRESVVSVSNVGFQTAFINVTEAAVSLALNGTYIGKREGLLEGLDEGTSYTITATDADEYVQTVWFETPTRRQPTLKQGAGVFDRTDTQLSIHAEVHDPDDTQPTIRVKVGLKNATQDLSNPTTFLAQGLTADTEYTVSVYLDERTVYSSNERTCKREVGECNLDTGFAPVTMNCGGKSTSAGSDPCTVDCVFEYRYMDTSRPYENDTETPKCFDGTHRKRLHIIHAPKNRGLPCPTVSTQDETCIVDRDCSYTAWSAWGRCIGGVQTRERQVLSNSSGRGESCDEDALLEQQTCVLSSFYRPGAGEPDQQYTRIPMTSGTKDWLDHAASGSLAEAQRACSTRVECTGITQRHHDDGDRYYLNGPRAQMQADRGSDFLHKLDAHPLGEARYTMAVGDVPCAADDDGRVRCDDDMLESKFGFTLSSRAGFTGVYMLQDDQGRVCAEDPDTSFLLCAPVDGEPLPGHTLAIENASEMRGGLKGLPCALIDGQVRCDVDVGDAFAFTPASHPDDEEVHVAIGASKPSGPRVVPYPLGIGALTSQRGRKRFTLSSSGSSGSEQWLNLNGPGSTFFEVHLDDARRRITCWKLDEDNMLRTNEGWDVVLHAKLLHTATQGEAASPFPGGTAQGNFTVHTTAIARGEPLMSRTFDQEDAIAKCESCGDCAGFSIHDDGEATLFRTVDELDTGSDTVHVRTAPNAGLACASEPAPWASALFVPPELRDETSSLVRVPAFTSISIFHAWANQGTDLADAFKVQRGQQPIDSSLLVDKRNVRKQTGFADAINDTRCVAMWRTGANPASDEVRQTWLLSSLTNTETKAESAVWTKKARNFPFVVQAGVYTLRPVGGAGYLGSRADGTAFVDRATVAYRADSWPLHLLFELHQPGDAPNFGWAMRNLYTEKYAYMDNGSRELSFDIDSIMYTSPLAMRDHQNEVQLIFNLIPFGTRDTDDKVVELDDRDQPQWFELALRSDTVPTAPADDDPSPNYVTTRNTRANTKTVLQELNSGETLDAAFASCSNLPQCAAVSQNVENGVLKLLSTYSDLESSDGIHLHQNRYYDPYHALAIAETQPETALESTQTEYGTASDTEPDVPTSCQYDVRSGYDFSIGNGLGNIVASVEDCKQACDLDESCAGFSRKTGQEQTCWFKTQGDWVSANSDVMGYMKSNTPCGVASVGVSTTPLDTVTQTPPPPAYTRHENQRQDPTDPRHLDSTDPTGQIANIRTYAAAKARCDANPACAGFHLNKNKTLYQFKSAINKLTTGRNFTTWTKQS
jgi:hypothetical protein